MEAPARVHAPGWTLFLFRWFGAGTIVASVNHLLRARRRERNGGLHTIWAMRGLRAARRPRASRWRRCEGCLHSDSVGKWGWTRLLAAQGNAPERCVVREPNGGPLHMRRMSTSTAMSRSTSRRGGALPMGVTAVCKSTTHLQLSHLLNNCGREKNNGACSAPNKIDPFSP